MNDDVEKIRATPQAPTNHSHALFQYITAILLNTIAIKGNMQ
jgi:hypothetical protein